MKSNNLSISIPNKGCNKNCPYCISKITGYMKSNNDVFYRNILKVKNYAKLANVSSISLTGKGEPLLNMPDLTLLIKTFNEFPVELQTNGILLNKDTIKTLYNCGLDVIAISIDDGWFYSDELKEIIANIKETGMTARLTINITSNTNLMTYSFNEFVDQIKKLDADQFSFRKIVSPSNADINDSTVIWINKNVDNSYEQLINEFKNFKDNFREIRKLPYGATVYDVKGISFTYFDYCIQDTNNTEDIRSLIYMEDGHLYTSWDSKASRLF